jgi:hypothetical protein
MEGMSNKSAEELIPLAKSWLRPAKLKVKSGCTSQGYDRSQRAYLLTATDSRICVLVKASKESPIVNLALVVKGWGQADAGLKMNGESVRCGKKFRTGYRHTAEGTDLIVWVKCQSQQDTKFEIESKGRDG